MEKQKKKKRNVLLPPAWFSRIQNGNREHILTPNFHKPYKKKNLCSSRPILPIRNWWNPRSCWEGISTSSMLQSYHTEPKRWYVSLSTVSGSCISSWRIDIKHSTSIPGNSWLLKKLTVFWSPTFAQYLDCVTNGCYVMKRKIGGHRIYNNGGFAWFCACWDSAQGLALRATRLPINITNYHFAKYHSINDARWIRNIPRHNLFSSKWHNCFNHRRLNKPYYCFVI